MSIYTYKTDNKPILLSPEIYSVIVLLSGFA
jgi:hypothetical protein